MINKGWTSLSFEDDEQKYSFLSYTDDWTSTNLNDFNNLSIIIMKINNFDYKTKFLYISKQFRYKRVNWMPHYLQPIALDHVFEAATIYSPKFKIFVDLQKQNQNSSRLLPLQIAMARSGNDSNTWNVLETSASLFSRSRHKP